MDLKNLKSIALAIAIFLGFIVQGHMANAARTETAILAGGCFWCVESDFEGVPGVINVVSGYTGGTTASPTYKQVSKGGTGHYEAVKITYDAGKVSYAQILHLFLRSVDPTDAGGQFCDRGDSYRTAIFARGPKQRATATAAIAQARTELGRRIVTPVLAATRFYKAEAYHQDYYKGKKLVITRRGPKRQAAAYRFYRISCGRDARVKALWGNAAPFADHY